MVHICTTTSGTAAAHRVQEVVDLSAKLGPPVDHAKAGRFPQPKKSEPDAVKHLLAVTARITELTDKYGVREVARQADISHSTLSRTVSGRLWPSAVMVARLEAAFDCNLWR